MLGECAEPGYPDGPMSPFLRHITACNNAVIPGGRRRLRIGAAAVGWVAPDLADALAGFPGIAVAAEGVTLAGSHAADLPGIARALAARGFYRWRDEAFDVRAGIDGPVLSTIDRGAVPAFGILAQGVHLNGLVDRPDGLHLWVARRAAGKLVDPGRFDHIVAGGMPAGLSAVQTLAKEAAEEAAIPAGLIAGARHAARIAYAMATAEGLRRDVLHCFDVTLPESFEPRAVDGEVESFALWPIGRALEAVRDGEAFKFNVNLVLIDLFIRRGLLAGAEAAALRAALDAGAAVAPLRPAWQAG
jgi:thiamine pyrophosphokinase